MTATKNKRAAAEEKRRVVAVRMQTDQLSAIDGWRNQQPDKPSRAEALRRLVAKALTTAGAH